MGAINYYTSDYITIGVNTNELLIDSFEWVEIDYNIIEGILNGENFEYFTVELKPGYYEGYSIDIKANFYFSWVHQKEYFDNSKEKAAAQKEITRIYKFLLRCVNEFSLVACYPGWCTGYDSREVTRIKLKSAVKEMRRKVESMPTWAQLKREEKTA